MSRKRPLDVATVSQRRQKPKMNDELMGAVRFARQWASQLGLRFHSNGSVQRIKCTEDSVDWVDVTSTTEFVLRTASDYGDVNIWIVFSYGYRRISTYLTAHANSLDSISERKQHQEEFAISDIMMDYLLVLNTSPNSDHLKLTLFTTALNTLRRISPTVVGGGWAHDQSHYAIIAKVKTKEEMEETKSNMLTTLRSLVPHAQFDYFRFYNENPRNKGVLGTFIYIA